MNILVAKNGSQLGPFSENDVRAKLASGEFSSSDYGWHEGLTAWSPLSQLLAAAPPPAPAPPPVAQPYSPQPYTAPAPAAQPQPYGAPQPYNSPYPSPYQQGAMPQWGPQGSRGYAGFWLRLVAHIIDTVVLYIPLFFLGIVVSLMFGGIRSSSDISPAVGFVILAVYLLYIVAVCFYFIVMESSARQATFGKMALGMKVTDLNGNRISFGQGVGRFFGKFLSGLIFGVGYIMAGVTERKQALHDMMAETLVVLK